MDITGNINACKLKNNLLRYYNFVKVLSYKSLPFKKTVKMKIKQICHLVIQLLLGFFRP